MKKLLSLLIFSLIELALPSQNSSVTFRLTDTLFSAGTVWRPYYPVVFSSDNTYNLNSDSNLSLDSLALFLNEHEGAIIEIAAHTDQRGHDSANVNISQKRAESVKMYLLSKGIEGQRLAAVGYGETQLIHSNAVIAACKSDSAKNLLYSENRRIEFRLVNDPDNTFSPNSTSFDSAAIWIIHVLFDLEKATLRSESKQLLDSVAAFLLLHDTLKIEIAGHTDLRRAETYSSRLSLARAETVKRYLITTGVPANQVTARGYEKNQPLVSADYIARVPSKSGKEELHSLNRRIEIRISDISE